MAKKQRKTTSPILIGGIIVLLGLLAVLMYALSKNTDNQSKAAAVVCRNQFEGECLDSPANTAKGNLKVGVNAADNKLLAAATDTAQCQQQVFLKIKYNQTNCLAGRQCDSLQARTAVGWVGGAAGQPFKYYADGVLIPLTDEKGVWIHDNPIYRSSPKVNGLGLVRIGDGRIIVSHANSDKTQAENVKDKTFQAIDAVMTVSGATTAEYINGDLNIAPDQPMLNGTVAGHGVDRAFDGNISRPPTYNNLLASKGIYGTGGDEIVWKSGTSSWQHFTRITWPGDDYVMTLKCPTKPPVVKCNLYPIALSKIKVEKAAVGSTISDIWNGSGQGNFGWLTWNGANSEPVLSTSLTPPGNSSNYVNPLNRTDHIVSVGDWIQSRPGVVNSSAVRTALETLKTQDIIVPVWDQSNCQGGTNAQYRTWKYAKVRIYNYDLSGGKSDGAPGACSEKPGKNMISATFKGFVDCEQ